MKITDQKKIEQYYQALVERDSRFIGIFYVGVKTTGIFCIATCRARKPKLENVIFYNGVRELLQNGFRPCKVCKPTEHAGDPPDEVIAALRLVQQHPSQKITDVMLEEEGLAPKTIRRWFKQHHNLTFHAYQRMLRVNTAFQALQKGGRVTDSAFDSGYESLSGFGYTFKTLTGVAPSDSKDKTVINMTRLATPLGPMFAAATTAGVCLLEFTDRKMLETELGDLQKRLNAIILAGNNPHLDQLKTELEAYFAGTRREFTVALDTPGSDFQQAAWQGLLKIPYGQTRSYQEQAERIGRPSAVRAVGTANGQNRISIVVPCHRVIGKDGSLTGYGGGIERKMWLLDHEKKQVAHGK